MKEFIHLHNHTHYSLLDAICTVDGLVNAAVENKMSAVALTDHGVMFGAMEFYNKCLNKGVKPIIGFEAYVAQGTSRFDKTKRTETYTDVIDVENSDGLSVSNINYAHLILLAKNNIGYKNLLKLNSIGHMEGFYYKPRIDLEVLELYKEGIVALSACAGGVISCYIVRDNMQKAREMTDRYKSIFGDDFYLEIQNHLTLDSEKKVLREMPKLAKEFGLKLIVTNDVHYIKKEHAIAHNIYLNISSKQNKNLEPRDLYEGKKTFLLLKAIEAATDVEDKELLHRIIENKGVKNEEEVQEVKSIYEKYGVIEAATKKVEEYTMMANEELNHIKESDAKSMLKWFSDMLLNRTT